MKDYPRKLRLNSQLQRELTTLVRALRDPRVAGVTLTAVDVSPDMRHARVHVSCLDPVARPDDAARALNGAAGRLRRELGHLLRLRHVPELDFRADHTAENADRLNRLIRDARSEDRQHASARGEPDG